MLLELFSLCPSCTMPHCSFPPAFLYSRSGSSLHFSCRCVLVETDSTQHTELCLIWWLCTIGNNSFSSFIFFFLFFSCFFSFSKCHWFRSYYSFHCLPHYTRHLLVSVFLSSLCCFLVIRVPFVSFWFSFSSFLVKISLLCRLCLSFVSFCSFSFSPHSLSPCTCIVTAIDVVYSFSLRFYLFPSYSFFQLPFPCLFSVLNCYSFSLFHHVSSLSRPGFPLSLCIALTFSCLA